MGFRRHLIEAHWRLYARHLAASKKPILIGPWRSEVGFEVLYWIPFLNAFKERYSIDPNRLIALGRGGSACWYGMAGQGDLYEHLPLETVRALSVQSSQQTGSIKQHTEEHWEHHVCTLAAMSIGIQEFHVLSPRWMYQLITPWWEGTASPSWLDQRLLHSERIQAPKLHPEVAQQLPEQYIAMRWYTRPTWPMQEGLILWTRKLVEAIASRIPVVLIQSGFHADDHADMNLGAIPNTINLKDIAKQKPTDNLAIQSAVIAKAQGYVGTYGGMSQLAMRLGIPTVALYAQFGQTAPAHLTLTQRLSLKSGVAFIACTPGQLDSLVPIILAPKKAMVTA